MDHRGRPSRGHPRTTVVVYDYQSPRRFDASSARRCQGPLVLKTPSYFVLRCCGGRLCGAVVARRHSGADNMLFLVFLLLALWALGVITSYTLGGVLHILLVIAIVLFLVHIIQGSSIGEA
jgi:hypothetical protein